MHISIIQLSPTDLVQPTLFPSLSFSLCPGPLPCSLLWESLSPSSLSACVPMLVSPSLSHPQDTIVACPQRRCPHPWWVSPGWLSPFPVGVPVSAGCPSLRWVSPGWMSPFPVGVPVSAGCPCPHPWWVSPGWMSLFPVCP